MNERSQRTGRRPVRTGLATLAVAAPIVALPAVGVTVPVHAAALAVANVTGPPPGATQSPSELTLQVDRLRHELRHERRARRIEIRNLQRTHAARLVALRHAALRSPDVQHAIDVAAVAYGVSPARLLRVASCESTFVPTARNGQYVGLFQFGSYLWNRSPFGRYQRTDPLASSFAAAWAFSRGYDGQWPVCGRQ